jgi:hypothetical protein
MGFINNIFKSSGPDNLTKIEYWKKWEFFELIDDLHNAKKMLSKYDGGCFGEYLSANEFHVALEDAIDEIEFGNQTDLIRFWFWFAPTSVWDAFVGEEGQELGNRIFERVDKWKKNQS